MENIKSIFITGASSGLGLALAQLYAKEGVIIGLAARRFDKLKSIKKELEIKKAKIYIYKLDVGNLSLLKKCADDFIKKIKTIDLVIANSGIGSKFHKPHYSAEEIAEIFQTNTIGVTNTISVFLDFMIKQKKGQLAAIGSVAGFRALPDSGYSASKSAVHLFMSSLRLRYSFYGIKFSTIAPGFIDTPFVKKHTFQMPFLLKPDKAAKLIKKALTRNKKLYIFPWQWKFIVPIVKILPDFLIRIAMKDKLTFPK
ncbi:MAG: SDR family NAD(P)-dependent oxidoreductase [Spirochaetia bacterium]|nr:SDR family NAD(P)-dependent oxidoreductase [Spirochaetia bacterium]